jgi:tRNA threonylcarbamoyladenosine biosynthesis protein TsaE
MELRLLKDTEELSKKISKIIKPGDIIFIQGEIGVGKTTFVRFLINHLEVENSIKKSDILSPTFNIVYNYEIGKINIQHYDLYRLKNYRDILELGIFENGKDSIKIIEWPELIEKKPTNRIDLVFKYSELMDYRKVNIQGFGSWKDYKFNGI